MNMLKLAGTLLLLTGSVGMAWTYRETLRTNIKQLQYLQQILQMFQSEIQYHKSTLPEACRQVGKRVAVPYKESLLHIYERMKENTGVAFALVWKEEMKACMERLCLAKKDKEIFLGIADNCGFADESMQLQALRQCEKEIGKSLALLEGTIENKSRVIMSTGIMGGILLIVLFI